MLVFCALTVPRTGIPYSPETQYEAAQQHAPQQPAPSGMGPLPDFFIDGTVLRAYTHSAASPGTDAASSPQDRLAAGSTFSLAGIICSGVMRPADISFVNPIFSVPYYGHAPPSIAS